MDKNKPLNFYYKFLLIIIIIFILGIFFGFLKMIENIDMKHFCKENNGEFFLENFYDFNRKCIIENNIYYIIVDNSSKSFNYNFKLIKITNNSKQ